MNALKIYLLAMVAVAGNAVAQSLNAYLAIAAQNNPALKSKYLRYQASLERVPQVGALPDPEVGFSFFLMPMERYMGNQVGSVSLMQMFPWFGALNDSRTEMSYMAKANFEEFSEARSMLFYEVKANWYALQLLNGEIKVAKENLSILQTMEQVAIARFKSGAQNQGSQPNPQSMRSAGGTKTGGAGTGMTGMNMQAQTPTGKAGSQSMPQMTGMESMGGGGSLVDVMRVQMEINELKNTLALLQDSRTPLIARFNQLLNREIHAEISLPDSIAEAAMPLAARDIPDSIRQRNPMLKMLEQEEAAYTAQGSMKKKMGMPMIGAGLQYDIFRARANSESAMNGRNMLMPMASVTIPLWRKNYAASVREADYLRKSVIEQKQETGNQLLVNYEEALKDFQDAERRVKLYQDQTRLANQVLNLLLSQYSTEGSNFEEVLRMEQQLLDYKFKYLDALADGHIAVAMMERLMGR